LAGLLLQEDLLLVSQLMGLLHRPLVDGLLELPCSAALALQTEPLPQVVSTLILSTSISAQYAPESSHLEAGSEPILDHSGNFLHFASAVEH